MRNLGRAARDLGDSPEMFQALDVAGIVPASHPISFHRWRPADPVWGRDGVQDQFS
jgi:hypothetical protein